MVSDHWSLIIHNQQSFSTSNSPVFNLSPKKTTLAYPDLQSGVLVLGVLRTNLLEVIENVSLLTTFVNHKLIAMNLALQVIYSN